MWRLIVVTFAFLAVAFYQLSGGSDYKPEQNSLQVQGLQRAEPVDVRVAGRESVEQSDVTSAVANLTGLQVEEDNRFRITLASVSASNEYDSTVQQPKVERVPGLINVKEALAKDAAERAAAQPEVTTERKQPESVATGFVGEEVFSLETYVMRQTDTYTIPESEEPAAADTTGMGDLRQVSGNLVNMRAGPGTDYETVGQLGKGTRIAVLEEPGNGWVMLEVVDTGEIGWMADWLITASN